MIQDILTTLLEVIVPLAIPVVVGALLARYRNLDTKPLITLYFYMLSPALIFDALLNAELTWDDVYKTVAFSLLNLVLLWAVARGIGRLLRLPTTDTAGLTLISTFTNSVNYGLPLVLLAFGQLGLDKASIYVISQMVIVNTIGIYFAARSHFSVRQAIRSVFALPAIYAGMAAALVLLLDVQLPEPLLTGISMVAAAYSPIVMAVLGVQMMNVRTERLEPRMRRALGAGLVIRLALAPAIAWLVLLALNVDGMLRAVLFILASMPVAVNAVMLSTRFDASPRLVAKCILWTTLASFLLLPVLITLVATGTQ
ncbi:AEC family transporter [Paenibacillus sp. IB182496]|uniref:AEC family transporter n=1 Tax=Paenibacillus sabuli TaxID=2772509 RepID=A0A927BW35_9BACL|nr:AEC family transporter [Paenibacillus sabuli]MBD2846715.1 AEC family transporter [Paenibacillus sabuli]